MALTRDDPPAATCDEEPWFDRSVHYQSNTYALPWCRFYHDDASVIGLRPKYQNHIWSIDFVHDRLSNGRSYKMLTVVDEYTREALCVSVAARMGSAEVLDALYPLLLKRGRP
jgi:transposase InsO family protein